MAKHLNVNLGFSADTSSAKNQLRDLQSQLVQLVNTTNLGGGKSFTISDEIVKATQAAAQLKVQLENATNVNTGKLDLGKFSQAMNQSGMSLAKYRDALASLGPTGDKAFATLATSITHAEVPLRRTNALLSEFGTTLKNTVRWQISSSLLHGFMGTLQSSVGFAKDLNKSLNDIRIVTGQSTEEMAVFADKANKAAVALNSTTTAYTNAALIYYQQGLGDKAVEERTNATIKMANVTGENAEEVSSYMTAIWNNFDNGSKSLEYYADVMTALGAATASSTDEIAAGLEKFAAISDTIGLSYEYAASALATVTAQTRQSADVVGTAFKTIFARIQGLNLGETLDDGTSLNKYSQALDKVGISIKDTNGEVKNMDAILGEMGSKWGTLAKDQQIALAQTVAGVRQYNQLIALMDNWAFFQENLATSYGSEGTLEEQAEIYAESWEAARKKVTASAEAIYKALLNDEFFIDINNVFADFLGLVKTTIDSLGGVKGILTTLGAVALTVFHDQMAQGLQNAIYNIRMLSKAGRDTIEKIRQDANNLLIDQTLGSDTTVGYAMGGAYKEQASLQQAYLANAEKMNAEQKSIAQSLLDQQNALIQNVRVSAEQVESLEKQVLVSQRLVVAKGKNNTQRAELQALSTDLAKTSEAMGQYQKALLQIGEMRVTPKNIPEFKNWVQSIKTAGVDIELAFGIKASSAFQKFDKALQTGNISKINNALNKMFSSADAVDYTEQKLDKLKATLMQLGVTEKDATRVAEQLRDANLKLGESTQNLGAQQSLLTSYTSRVSEAMSKLAARNFSTADGVIALAGSLSSVAMGLQMVIGLTKTWNNEDISIGEKLLSTMVTLGMVIPIVTRAFSANSLAQTASLSASIATALGFNGAAISALFAADSTAKFGTKLWATLWPIGLVVAAIAGLVAIVYGLVKAYNADADAAEKANKQARNQKKIYQETKDAYDALKKSIEDYTNAQNAIDELKTGTEEWKTAIQEANEEILNLLGSYPKLAEYISNVNGRLQISTAGLEALQSEQEKALQASYRTSLMAEVRAKRAQNKSDTTDLGRSIGYADYNNEQEYTQVGSSNINKVLDAIAEQGKGVLTDSETLAKATGISNKPLIDALIANKEELLELSNSVQANTLSNDLMNEQIASSYLSENEQFNNSKYQSELAKMVSDASVESSNLTAKESKYDSMTDAEIQKDYAKLMGWNTSNISNDWGKGTYNFADGTESKVVDDEIARAALAQQAALEEAGQSVNDYVVTLENASKKGDSISKGLGNMMVSFVGGEGGNFADATQTQIKSLQETLNSTEFTPTDIISDEDAKNMGYEDAQKYCDALQSSIDDFNNDWKSVELPDDLLGIDNLSLSTAKKLTEIFKDVKFGALGEEGGEKFVSGLNKILDGLDTEDQTKVLNALSDVDWSAWDAGKQVAKIMSDLGYQTNMTDEEWIQFVEDMRKANNASPIAAFKELKETLQSISSIVSDMEIGSIIDDDDYQTLIDYNAELEKSFLTMADGSHKLLTSVDSLNTISFENTIAQMREAQSAFENFNPEDFGWTEEDGTKTAFNWEKVADGTYKFSQEGLTNLKAMSGEYETVLNQVGYTDERLQEIITHIEQGAPEAELEMQKLGESMSSFLASGENGEFSESVIEEMIASTATNMAQLDRMFADGTIGVEAFSKAYTALNTENELAGLDAKEVGEFGDYLQEAAKDSKLLDKSLTDNAKAADEVAASIMRMNRGVDKLAEGFEDWNDVLKKSDKSSQEYYDALDGMKEAMSDVLGVSKDWVSSDFITNHLDDIKLAADGSAEAIDRLKQAAATDILMQSIKINLDLDDSEAMSKATGIMSEIQGLIDAQGPLAVGATLDDADFLAAMQDIVTNAGLTADQANAMFSSMGFETEFATETKPVKKEGHGTRTTTELLGEMPVEMPDGSVMTVPAGWETKTYAGEPYTYVDYVDTIAMATNADGQPTKTPKIKSFTKTATGAMNNYSSSNTGGPPAGGKKGGGGSKAKTKEKKKLGDELERYHEIKASIEDLTSALSDLSKAKDRAWGLEKLKLIDAEIAKTQDLITLQKNYIAEIEKNLSADKTAIAAYGAQFDENGNISNYSDIVATQVAKYNEAVDAFNRDQNEETFEMAEKAYEEFQKVLDQYEETNNLLQDEQRSLNDKILEELDKKLEKIKEAVSMKVSVRDDDIEYLEYQLGKLEDQAFSTAKALALMSTNVQALMDQSTFYSQGIKDILALQEAGGTLTADQIDTLREYKSSLLDINKQLMDMKKTMEDSVLEGIEEYTDKLDKGISRFDTYSDIMSNYINIIELSGRATKDNALIMELSAAATDNAMNKLKGTKNKYDALLASQASAERNLANAKDAESIEMWTKTLEEIKIKVEDAQNEMQQSWADALEAASEQFDKTVEISIKKLEDALSPFKDLDTFADAYDKVQTIAEQYLSTNQQIYELSKLTRNINQSIDDTTNLAAKTKLKDLLEEINTIQEKNNKLSQYDLEYLQGKYDLELAAIALQEAQNAKDQVRLTRDSEGNWGYTYTADQEKIDDAQQNYEDKLYNLQKLSEDYIKNLSGQIIQNQQEMSEALANINKEDYDNAEDYYKALENTANYYYERDRYLRTELDKAVQNSGITYGDTILGQMENASSWEEAHNKVVENTNKAIDSMNDAYNVWKDNVDEAMKSAGTSSEDFTEDVTDDLEEIMDKSDELEETLEDDSEKMIDYISDIMRKVSEWQRDYASKVREMIQSNEALVRSINAVIAAQAGMGSLSGGGYDAGVDYSALMAAYLAADPNHTVNDEEYLRLKEQRDNKITGEDEWNHLGPTDDSMFDKNSEWFKKAAAIYGKDWEKMMNDLLSRFDTGGYTGEWGPDMKLAGLHEKELVLNKDDTANFLKAIDVVRTITDVLDQKTVLASLGLNNVSASGLAGFVQQSLQQDVLIKAEFPGVTDHNEIEIALQSLVNQASQFANRKK